MLGPPPFSHSKSFGSIKCNERNQHTEEMIAPLSLAAKQTLIFPAQLPKCFSAIVPLDVRAEHEATRQAPAPCSAGLVKQLLFFITTPLTGSSVWSWWSAWKANCSACCWKRCRKQEWALASWCPAFLNLQRRFVCLIGLVGESRVKSETGMCWCITPWCATCKCFQGSLRGYWGCSSAAV